eukprot:m.1434121 g.1434121  ORF g.1434121 m.1434121 type:complete len:58 (-) comp25080_c0_seq44:46-219(-)
MCYFSRAKPQRLLECSRNIWTQRVFPVITRDPKEAAPGNVQRYSSIFFFHGVVLQTT